MSTTKVRIGIYGTGHWANRCHISNLLAIDDAEIVSLCDTDPAALSATSERLPGAHAYADGRDMLEREDLDALYSCVRAHVRGEIEIEAARRGIHIFCEKPQGLSMEIPRNLDRAIQEVGVLSTVCFRERYRPLFQEAKRILADKQVCHARYSSPRGLPVSPKGGPTSISHREELTGGPALNWGCHAVDYVRFITGCDIDDAQAFYCHREGYYHALTASFNFRLSNGGTMDMSFFSTMSEEAVLPDEPPFSFYFEGGRLDLFMYDRLEVNGEIVYHGEEYDPWFEQDRIFVDAVRRGDGSEIQSDFHDGLFSLAPVLAGWQSGRENGRTIRVSDFMER